MRVREGDYCDAGILGISSNITVRLNAYIEMLKVYLSGKLPLHIVRRWKRCKM